MTEQGRFHALTWGVWALAVSLVVQVAGQPVVALLVLVMSWVTVSVHGRDRPLARAFPVLVTVGAAFGLVKVVLTVLTTHGMGDALLTLPRVTLPGALGGFTLGGTVEDQVLARSVAEAFTVVAVMGAFGAFNAVVSHDELIRTLPRAFHELGLILAVGLTFVPVTVTSVREVQESDRARTGGAPVRRRRWVRLAVPVLERGMERAVLLGESMDARGFARLAPSTSERASVLLAAAGSASLAGSVVALVGQSDGLALAMATAGAGCIATGVLVASRGTRRTRYRSRSPGRADLAVMAVSLAGAGLMILAVAAGQAPPWPSDDLLGTARGMGWPRLGSVPLAALALLTVPAVVGAP